MAPSPLRAELDAETQLIMILRHEVRVLQNESEDSLQMPCGVFPKSIVAEMSKFVLQPAFDEPARVDCEAPTSLKIPLIGGKNVGKTTFAKKWLDGAALSIGPYLSRLGKKAISVEHEGTTHDLDVCLWDTASDKRFQSLSPKSSQGANAMIFMYDASEPASSAEVGEWLERTADSFADFNSEDTPKVLVANKCDLADEGESKQRHDLEQKLVRKYQLNKVCHISSSEDDSSSIKKGVDQLSQSVLAQRERHSQRKQRPFWG